MDRIRNIIIDPEISIKQALKKMDEAGKKVLFVVDKENTILGIVSDGDIRRWILKNRGLGEAISGVMNKEPVVLQGTHSKEDARKLMMLHGLECIPIIDETRKIVSAVWWLDIFGNNFKKHKSVNVPVVVMAGGEGARLSPFTNILPKPLMPIGEKPIIELIIEKFRESGCNDFYLSVNHKANILKAYFSDHKLDYNVHYIHEDKPLGTAGSLYLLRDVLDKTFFVSNCDILIEADYSDIVKFHKDSNNAITLVVSLKHYAIPYGICEFEDGGLLKKIKEKPEYDFLVNTGLYIMEKEVLSDIPEKKPYNMTDLLNDYIRRNKKIGIYPVSEKSWLDMGQFQELKNMLQKFEVK